MSTIAAAATKRIIAIRHSTTECNEALSLLPWGSPNFKDPMLYDTKLSAAGITKAEAVHQQLKARHLNVDFSSVQLVCTSPLSRAIHTADILLKDGVLPHHVPRLAQPLLRERLYLSSDVGKARSILQQRHASWDFSLLPCDDAPWWYLPPPPSLLHPAAPEWRPAGTYTCPGEPQDVFRERISELKRWLLARPEEEIVIVAHWGLLRGLFGLNAENCGIHILSGNDFLPTPPLDC